MWGISNWDRKGQGNTLTCIVCGKEDNRYSPTGKTCRSEKCKKEYRNERGKLSRERLKAQREVKTPS